MTTAVRDHRGGDRGHPRRHASSSSSTTRTARTRATSTIAAQFATPEAINFMATHGRGLDLPLPDRGALRRARPAADDRPQRDAVRDRLHGLDRGARGRHDRHLGADRSRTIQVAIDPSKGATTSSSPATSSRCARARAACSSAPARRRPRSTSRGSPGLIPGGRRLRGDERGRDDGARARPRPLLRAARAEDGHRRRPDRVPARAPSSSSSAMTQVRLPTPYGEFTADRVPRAADRASTTSRSSAARSTGRRTCSCACTPSA